MSENTVVYNTQNQMQVQTNLAKLFPFDKELKQYSYNSSGYNTETLLAGMVMGVIAATGLVVQVDTTAVDGSQFPIGVLAEDYTLPEGTLINVAVMVKGRVREDMLRFRSGQGLTTIVSSRRMFERIGSDSVGILIITALNCTNFDNTLPGVTG